MRASEFLAELFAPKQRTWHWEFRGSEEAIADFDVGEVPYRFHAYSNGTNDWEIEFKVRATDNSRDARQQLKTRFGLTGTGNSAEVMSTVVDIMREFLQMYNGKIDTLGFSAEEPSRQKLYMRMMKRLLPNWDIHTYDAGSGLGFTVVAPEQLDEVGDTFYDVNKGKSFSPSMNLKIKTAKGVVHPTQKSDSFNFTTDSGTKYVIKLYPTTLKDGGEAVAVTFGKASMTYDDTYGITGEGDAVKVFSTVKAVLSKYLSEHPDIRIINFSAKENEPSRVKLYTTFAKQFKRWFPDFTHIDITPMNGLVRFSLMREV